MNDMKMLPLAIVPESLTVTMELSCTDILVLEEIAGEQIETEEQAIHALKIAMIQAD